MPPLKDLFNMGNNPLQLNNYSFPYSGGTYKTSTAQALLKTPGGAPVAPTAPVVPVVPGAPAGKKGTQQIFKTNPPAQEADLYAKYRDPSGKIMTPEEYANAMALKASSSIPQYAGDAITHPNQSIEELNRSASLLNNTHNDIATGETDPYKAASKSGLQYSPAELAAIEKAYAGVYDPALTDVFTKLEAKQKADEAATKAKQDREDRIFATNESIRQWKATTGSKGAGGSGEDMFTRTQLNNGAADAKLGISDFESLDNDIKNFYISAPTADDGTGKQVPKYRLFEDLLKQVKDGTMSVQEASDTIESSTTLPEAVKHYFIDQMPLAPEEKDGYFTRIWKAITGQ